MDDFCRILEQYHENDLRLLSLVKLIFSNQKERTEDEQLLNTMELLLIKNVNKCINLNTT